MTRAPALRVHAALAFAGPVLGFAVAVLWQVHRPPPRAVWIDRERGSVHEVSRQPGSARLTSFTSHLDEVTSQWNVDGLDRAPAPLVRALAQHMRLGTRVPMVWATSPEFVIDGVRWREAKFGFGPHGDDIRVIR